MTEPTLAQRLRKCANPSWDPLMNEAAAALEAQAAQIAERDAQIEALRADAERYRWLVGARTEAECKEEIAMLSALLDTIDSAAKWQATSRDE